MWPLTLNAWLEVLRLLLQAHSSALKEGWQQSHFCPKRSHVQLVPQSERRASSQRGQKKTLFYPWLVVECGQTQWDRMLTVKSTECWGGGKDWSLTSGDGQIEDLVEHILQHHLKDTVVKFLIRLKIQEK